MNCKNCGNKLENGDIYCSNCGTKNEKKKTNILVPITGISSGVIFVLGLVNVFLGIFLCFPDPQTGENISGLNFNIFGNISAIMFVISVVLFILFITLVVLDKKKN